MFVSNQRQTANSAVNLSVNSHDGRSTDDQNSLLSGRKCQLYYFWKSTNLKRKIREMFIRIWRYRLKKQQFKVKPFYLKRAGAQSALKALYYIPLNMDNTEHYVS